MSKELSIREYEDVIRLGIGKQFKLTGNRRESLLSVRASRDWWLVTN